jgi:hypothetical protein
VNPVVLLAKADAHVSLADEAVRGGRDDNESMLTSAQNLWLAWLALENAEHAGAEPALVLRARWAAVAFFSGTWAPLVYAALPRMSSSDRKEWASGLAAWIGGVAGWQRRLVSDGVITGSAADEVGRMTATLEATLPAIEAAAQTAS